MKGDDISIREPSSDTEIKSIHSYYNDGENKFMKERASKTGSPFVTEMESFSKISNVNLISERIVAIIRRWFTLGKLIDFKELETELPVWNYICRKKYNIHKKSDLFRVKKLKKSRSKEQYIKFVFRQFIKKELKENFPNQLNLPKCNLLIRYYRSVFGKNFRKYKLFSHVKNEEGYQTISEKYLQQLNNDFPMFIRKIKKFAEYELCNEYYADKDFKDIAMAIKKREVDWKNTGVNRKELALPLDFNEVEESKSCFLNHMKVLLQEEK